MMGLALSPTIAISHVLNGATIGDSTNYENHNVKYALVRGLGFYVNPPMMTPVVSRNVGHYVH